MGSRGRCCFLGLFLFLSTGGGCFRVPITQPFLHLLSPTLLRGGILGPHEGIWGIPSYDKFVEPQDFGSSDQILVLKVVGLEAGCCGGGESGTSSERVGSTWNTDPS